MRVFLDANILIDMSDENRKTYEDSLKIFYICIKDGVELYTSCDLVTTVYYILAKKGREYAMDSVERLNKFCHIIEFSNKDVSLAISLMRQNSNYKDFEDTLQYVLAKKSSCDVIISNDKNFFSEDIKVYRSDEYLKRIEE